MVPFRLVLVRPQFGGNLGACARVAANFNLTDNVMVSSFCSIHDSEAKRYATNEARAFLDNFKSVSDLGVALNDCHISVGFTCRDGLLRNPTIELGELAALSLGGKKVALVFGNEKVGLDSDELSRCTQVCHIPTASIHESLNLSHAVAVVVARIYEDCQKFSQQGSIANSISENEIPTLQKFEQSLATWKEILGGDDDPKRVFLQFKRFLGRTQLDQNELELFELIFKKIKA